jgi:2-methylcitrate dehydratase PrpD
MGATAEFCRIMAAISADNIPPDALAAGRRLILDGVAVAVAGGVEQAPRILARHLRDLGGAPQAAVINFGFRASPVSAAYINGAAMHVLDFEPMWDPPNHALSTTLPAVLALGETVGADGREMLAALIKGTEAQGRLRVASVLYEPRELTFHPPGVVGVAGAAVAASHLLKLGADAMRHAVGIAASRASSLIGNVGTMTKSTHCGLAAAMGVDAAMLAAAGFTANPDIIEAPNGMAAAFFAHNWNPDALTVADAPLRIVEPGYAIKMFPSQYATHFAIQAALDARAAIPDGGVIEAAEIIGPVMPYVDRPSPQSGLEGKFSFQYAAACALLDGRVGIHTFSDERRSRPDVQATLPRIRFVQSPEIPATLNRMWVEIRLTLGDGRVVTGKCVKPAGAWGNPVSETAHLAKVRDCLKTAFDAASAEEIIAATLRFDALDAAAVRDLMRRLGNFPAAPSGDGA